MTLQQQITESEQALLETLAIMRDVEKRGTSPAWRMLTHARVVDAIEHLTKIVEILENE